MMIDLQAIHKCLCSLLMHRLRTLLSTLGVLFGVAAVIAMLSIGEGAKQETLEQIEQLGMNSLIIRQNALSEDQQKIAFERRSKGLTEQDGEAMEKNVPFLTYQAPVKVIEASVSGMPENTSPEILGVTPAFGEMKQLKLAEGRFICGMDRERRQLVCVLGYEAAKSLGEQGHSGNSIRIENTQYEIVGVLKPTQWKASKNSAITTRNLKDRKFKPGWGLYHGEGPNPACPDLIFFKRLFFQN